MLLRKLREIFTFMIIIGLVIFSLTNANNPIQSNLNHRSIVLVLDASGSMSEKLNGSTRMQIAVKEIESFVKELPENTELGLVAYGNRIPGCNSSRLYSPIQKNSKSEVLSKLPLFFPAGSTPIARTLELINKHLLNYYNNTEIILISDGIESCDGDPTFEIREIRKKNPNIQLHVLGLDVPSIEEKELEILAGAGGGKYYSIRNSETMNQAFASIWNKSQISESIAIYPYIKITGLEKISDSSKSGISEYNVSYEYRAKKNHIDRDYTVQILIYQSTDKLSETPPMRIPKSDWITLNKSIDHTNSQGEGRVNIAVLDDSKSMVSTELWDMNSIPIPIAISSSVYLHEIKK